MYANIFGQQQSRTLIEENSRVDQTYSLDFYVLSSLISGGTQVFVREMRYEYDYLYLQASQTVQKTTTNILAVIYQGILDLIIVPNFSLHLATETFIPGDELTMIIVAEEHRIQFYGLEGHYFSLIFSNDVINLELGQLGLLVVQKKRQYNVLSVTNRPAQKPIRNGRDFIEHLEHQISNNKLLVSSLRLLYGFRYFYKYRAPVLFHIKNTNPFVLMPIQFTNRPA